MMHLLKTKKFEDDFLYFCESENLFTGINDILISVSGGVDSMVLLTLLWKYKAVFNYKLTAAHFNHLSRAGASDNDEKLVTDYCHSLKIPFYTDRADVKKIAAKQGVSFEMAGRQLRYQFLNDLSQKLSIPKIATAHIQSDNTETILLRLINGTGLQGLAGIQVKRDNIIRPLLFAKKEDLYQYAENCNIPFHDDHTNFENECQRNIIRNEILPVIRKELNPNIDNNLENFSSIMQEYASFIKKEATGQYSRCLNKKTSWYMELDSDRLKALEPAIRKEVLLIAFHDIDNNITNYPSFHYMEAIEDLLFSSETGRFIEPVNDIVVLKDRDQLIVLNKENNDWQELKINPGKIYTSDSFIFSSKFIKFEDFSGVNNSRNLEYIDADKIIGKLKLRQWRQGDRFSPLGSCITKKLSDFFIDNKIARFLKEHIPILWDEEKIIWVCGLQINDHVKITKKTKIILKLEYKEI